jgi:tRNA threonylcarbamoyladenosine biosynthesis protein TsaB
VKILALDATTEACSVALADGPYCIFRYEEPGRGHAERILGMVEELLAESGWTLGALDGIAASIGPGAFTGIRITVAAAQGLAFGADLPVVGVSTLAALAFDALAGASVPGAAAPGAAAPAVWPANGLRHALACLDARMSEVYWARYVLVPGGGILTTHAPEVGPPASVRLDAGVPHLGVGRGFSAHPELLRMAGLDVSAQASLALPHARAIAALGTQCFGDGAGIDPAELAPLYVRDKVALTAAERGVPAR